MGITVKVKDGVKLLGVNTLSASMLAKLSVVEMTARRATVLLTENGNCPDIEIVIQTSYSASKRMRNAHTNSLIHGLFDVSGAKMRVYLYYWNMSDNVRQWEHVTAHELGHAYYYAHMFATMYTQSDVENEIDADKFAACVTRDFSGRYNSCYALYSDKPYGMFRNQTTLADIVNAGKMLPPGFDDESVRVMPLNKTAARKMYKDAYALGQRLGAHIHELLPIVRSGKRVHLLARDMETIGRLFDGYKNVSVAWGLSRSTARREHVFEYLVEGNGIRPGDYVIDTGFMGSIPKRISEVLEGEVKCILLSGEPNSYGRRISEDSAVRSDILTFEHSPKYTVNAGDHNTTVSIVDKTVRTNAAIFRLGFLAGVMGLPMAKKFARVEKYREAMMTRIASYQQTGNALRTVDKRAKWAGQWTLVREWSYGRGDYWDVVRRTSEHVLRHKGKDLVFSRKDYAERAAKALEDSSRLRPLMERISKEYLFPGGVTGPNIFVDYSRTVEYENIRNDMYLTILDKYDSKWLMSRLARSLADKVQGMAIDSEYLNTYDKEPTYHRIFVTFDSHYTPHVKRKWYAVRIES